MELIKFFKNMFTIAEPYGFFKMFLFTFIVLAVLFKDIKNTAKILTKVLLTFSIFMSILAIILK